MQKIYKEDNNLNFMEEFNIYAITERDRGNICGYEVAISNEEAVTKYVDFLVKGGRLPPTFSHRAGFISEGEVTVRGRNFLKKSYLASKVGVPGFRITVQPLEQKVSSR